MSASPMSTVGSRECRIVDDLRAERSARIDFLEQVATRDTEDIVCLL